MFGYINIYKNELKIKDYDLFRAYYCGLCKALGRRYNQLVRIGLSYDMTFLAILADSLNDTPACLEKDGCVKHIGRHMICQKNSFIDFCADVSIIMCYFKLSDDVSDNHSIKSYLMRMAYLRARKKAISKYPGLAESIKNDLDNLAALEKVNCDVIDKVAHPFACITQHIFETVDSSLSQLGYNIGRFIYIADALADIDEDMKSGSYNPYLFMYEKKDIYTGEFIRRAAGSINMTMSAIAAEYQKLTILKNKALLDNIIYMGIRFSAEKIIRKMEENNEKSL